MAKKEQLDPKTNDQVENLGDESHKVEEPNQSPQEQVQPEEAVTEVNSTDAVEANEPEAPEAEPLEQAEATGETENSTDSAAEEMDVVEEVEVEDSHIESTPVEASETVQDVNPDYQQQPSEIEEPISEDAEVATSVEEAPKQEAEEVVEEGEGKDPVDVVEDKEPSQEVETSEEPVVEESVEPIAKETQEQQEEVESKPEEVAEEKPAEETEAESDDSKKATEGATKEVEEDYAEKYASLNREELVLALEALVKNEDVNFIRQQIGFIKVAFYKLVRSEKQQLVDQSIESGEEIAEGVESVEEQIDPLKIRFDEAFKVYKSKKSEFDKALESQKQENLAAKEAILEDLRNLIESEEELKKTYDQFRDLQEKWRNIGPVPQLAKNNLWNNYHFLIEKFFDKVKINQELKDLDLKKNLELKTELCEKAEELLLETSIVSSFQKLQKLHDTWKETGPVPNDKKDEIWERFRAATVKINQRREEHYKGLSQEQEKNYAAKLVLCEKAEQIAELGADNPRKWQVQTNQINELFKVWKTIGFAPKKVNNDIWNRFRNALNAFFRNKKEYFAKFKDVQTENYNQKLNLCIQAEALKDSNDWGKATNEFISLQKQWKEIGQVPPKFSEKIWKRFRAACDEFFNRKSEFFSNIDQAQDENLNLKKELVEKIKSHPYTEDNTENLKVLNDFQRQWMEIGHVPIKQKDKIHAEFRKAIDDKFESLGISRKAKTAMSFRSKLDNIKTNPNADSIIYKERTFLLNKISQLQNDINLWENNIGFFASSKKADLLKKEFEDKIEKAKQDIAIMEEKLKILREQ